MKACLLDDLHHPSMGRNYARLISGVDTEIQSLIVYMNIIISVLKLVWGCSLNWISSCINFPHVKERIYVREVIDRP